jgi:hypothetical protein
MGYPTEDNKDHFALSSIKNSSSLCFLSAEWEHMLHEYRVNGSSNNINLTFCAIN